METKRYSFLTDCQIKTIPTWIIITIPNGIYYVSFDDMTYLSANTAGSECTINVNHQMIRILRQDLVDLCNNKYVVPLDH